MRRQFLFGFESAQFGVAGAAELQALQISQSTRVKQDLLVPQSPGHRILAQSEFEKVKKTPQTLSIGHVQILEKSRPENFAPALGLKPSFAFSKDNPIISGLDSAAFYVAAGSTLLAILAGAITFLFPNPVTPVITKILASKAVDSAVLANSAYLFARALPHGVEAGSRLINWDYQDGYHSPIGDALNIAGLGVMAVGIKWHANSYFLGAREAARTKAFYQGQGWSKEVSKARAKVAGEYVRRMSRHPRSVEEMVQRGEFGPNLGAYYTRVAAPTQWILEKSVYLDSALVASNLYEFNNMRSYLKKRGLEAPDFNDTNFILNQIAILGPWAGHALYKKAFYSRLNQKPLRTEQHTVEDIVRETIIERDHEKAKRDWVYPHEERLERIGRSKKELTKSPHSRGQKALLWTAYTWESAHAKISRDYGRWKVSRRAPESLLGARLRNVFGKLPKQKSQHDTINGGLPTRKSFKDGLRNKLIRFQEHYLRVSDRVKKNDLSSPQELFRTLLQEGNLRAKKGKFGNVPGAYLPHQFALDSLRELKTMGYHNFDDYFRVRPDEASLTIGALTPSDFVYLYNAHDHKGKRLLSSETFAKMIFRTDDWHHAGKFPLGGRKEVETAILNAAKASDQRYAEGRPLSIYDGVPYYLKDIWVGQDGMTTGGSAGARISHDQISNLSQKMSQELGMIEFRGGATQGGRGGTARDVNGTFVKNDAPEEAQTIYWDGERFTNTCLAGSSGPSCWAVQKYFPFAIASDTGGSAKAPPGVGMNVASIVPEQDSFSRVGLYPYHIYLDHSAFFAKGNLRDAQRLASMVSPEWSLKISEKKPLLVYLDEDLAWLSKHQSDSAEGFQANLEYLNQTLGFDLLRLDDPEWRYLLGQFQMEMYGAYSMVGAAYAEMNPKQRNVLGEAPRYGSYRDRNSGGDRMPKAEAALEFYPEMQAIVDRYARMISELIGQDVVIALSVSQRIPEKWSRGFEEGVDLSQLSDRDYHVILGDKANNIMDNNHDMNNMPSDFIPWWKTVIQAARSPKEIGSRVMFMGNPEAVNRVMYDLGEWF